MQIASRAWRDTRVMNPVVFTLPSYEKHFPKHRDHTDCRGGVIRDRDSETPYNQIGKCPKARRVGACALFSCFDSRNRSTENVSFIDFFDHDLTWPEIWTTHGICWASITMLHYPLNCWIHTGWMRYMFLLRCMQFCPLLKPSISPPFRRNLMNASR